MMSAGEYIESLRRLGPRTVYLFGERVENPVDHPLIRPSVNACARTTSERALASGSCLASTAASVSAVTEPGLAASIGSLLRV